MSRSAVDLMWLYFLFIELMVNTYEDLTKKFSVSWGLALLLSFQYVSSFGRAMA